MLHALRGASGKRILELGGGHSRILRVLARRNECWNVDKFEGLGGGPNRIGRQRGKIRIVRDYMGAFNPALPNGYFDCIVSASAVEHIPDQHFADVIRDCHRVLKPGGVMFHAVDLYLLDDPSAYPHGARQQARLELYASVPEIVNGGFEWLEPPALAKPAKAHASFAANSCDELHFWNAVAPSLKGLRENALSCSLRMGQRKTA